VVAWLVPLMQKRITDERTHICELGLTIEANNEKVFDAHQLLNGGGKYTEDWFYSIG